jgi:hypothetical protein
MKKQFTHEELSDKKCECGKRLKKRIVVQKPSIKDQKCYNCWIADQALVSGKSPTFTNKARRETKHAEETRV